MYIKRILSESFKFTVGFHNVLEYSWHCYQEGYAKREQVKGQWRSKGHVDTWFQSFTCDLLMTGKPV